MFVATKLFHKAGEGSGGGGGDQHNLGWYATESALTTAYATASDGDWAIVGATDTVWVWDSDTTAWKDTGQAGIELPSQTGNSGKFLTTNGTAASWSDKPLVNKSTESTSLTIFSYNGSSYGYNTNIGYSSAGGYCCTAVGAEASAGNNFACAFGQGAKGQGQWSIALGYKAKATQSYGIQIGPGTNSTPNSLSVALSSTSNYALLSSDGTIPEARLADTTNAQQGDVLTLDANGDAVWQAGSGGGLPSQTGQSGKFLTTDGTDASWSDKPLVNTATGTRALCIGNASSSGNYSIVIDSVGASSTADDAINIGARTRQSNYNLLIGASNENMPKGCIFLNGTTVRPMYQNIGVGEFWIGVSMGSYGAYYQITDRFGHIPTARLTKVNTTITLAAADWSSNTQTVSVTGMSADGVVMVSPDPTDQSAYTSAGILCTAQAAGTLTFACDTVPSADIDVNVVML